MFSFRNRLPSLRLNSDKVTLGGWLCSGEDISGLKLFVPSNIEPTFKLIFFFFLSASSVYDLCIFIAECKRSSGLQKHARILPRDYYLTTCEF